MTRFFYITLLLLLLPAIATASQLDFDKDFVYIKTDLNDLYEFKRSNNEELTYSYFTFNGTDYDFVGSKEITASLVWFERSPKASMVELTDGSRYLLPITISDVGDGSNVPSFTSDDTSETLQPDLALKLDYIYTLLLISFVLLVVLGVCYLLYKAVYSFFTL